MELTSVLKSREDDSVNFVFKGDFPYFFEARYVRRKPNYFVVYFSSQSGCDKACRFCHLTNTAQTQFANANHKIYFEQARAVLEWYDQNAPKADVVHFNFMARGEALANPFMLNHGNGILRMLENEAVYRNLFPKYLVSTIMPEEMKGKRIVDVFPVLQPEMYYSIYSVDDNFRKRWMPKALPADQALGMLADWQRLVRKIPVLHWCFIEGENDSQEDILAICERVNSFGLRVDVNIVRYNPYSKKFGQEASEETIQRNAEIMRANLPLARIKVVPRVGFDVKASCGMFVPGTFNEQKGEDK